MFQNATLMKYWIFLLLRVFIAKQLLQHHPAHPKIRSTDLRCLSVSNQRISFFILKSNNKTFLFFLSAIFSVWQ